RLLRQAARRGRVGLRELTGEVRLRLDQVLQPLLLRQASHLDLELDSARSTAFSYESRYRFPNLRATSRNCPRRSLTCSNAASMQAAPYPAAARRSGSGAPVLDDGGEPSDEQDRQHADRDRHEDPPRLATLAAKAFDQPRP